MTDPIAKIFTGAPMHRGVQPLRRSGTLGERTVQEIGDACVPSRRAATRNLFSSSAVKITALKDRMVVALGSAHSSIAHSLGSARAAIAGYIERARARLFGGRDPNELFQQEISAEMEKVWREMVDGVPRRDIIEADSKAGPAPEAGRGDTAAPLRGFDPQVIRDWSGGWEITIRNPKGDQFGVCIAPKDEGGAVKVKDSKGAEIQVSLRPCADNSQALKEFAEALSIKPGDIDLTRLERLMKMATQEALAGISIVEQRSLLPRLLPQGGSSGFISATPKITATLTLSSDVAAGDTIELSMLRGGTKSPISGILAGTDSIREVTEESFVQVALKAKVTGAAPAGAGSAAKVEIDSVRAAVSLTLLPEPERTS